MRNNTQWFEFAGKRSDEMGVYPADMPLRVTPAPRFSAHTVAGRDGCLYLSDNTLSETDVTRLVRLHESRLSAAQDWLRGAGQLRFSHRPDAVFDARVTKKVEFRQLLPGADPLWECAVTFTCQPRPWLHPAAEESVFTVSGLYMPVPKGMTGLPRITVTGSGDFTLALGGQTLFFTGVEDGVIVDSELGDALTPDGSALLNACLSGPLPTLTGPDFRVTWTAGSENAPGSVEKVTILPRWRHAV